MAVRTGTFEQCESTHHIPSEFAILLGLVGLLSEATQLSIGHLDLLLSILYFIKFLLYVTGQRSCGYEVVHPPSVTGSWKVFHRDWIVLLHQNVDSLVQVLQRTV